MHDPSVAASASNDFRERFHRPLVAPSPFRTAVTPPHHPGIGPTLTNAGAHVQAQQQDSRSPTLETPSPSGQLNPQLGQGRDEGGRGGD